MIIERNESNYCRIADMKCGECFEYQEAYYIKTDRKDDATHCCCVDLASGEIFSYICDADVKKINMKAVVVDGNN